MSFNGKQKTPQGEHDGQNFLLEYLMQNQFFGVALTYPDGEPLQVECLTAMYAEQAERLTRRGVSSRT